MSDGSPGSNQHRRSQASQIARAYRTANEILTAAIGLGVLAGGGYWLDIRLGWTPALTICGACLGFVLAGVSLRALLRRLDQESKTKRRKSGGEETQTE